MIIVYYKQPQNLSCFATTNIYCLWSLVSRPARLSLKLWALFRAALHVFILGPRLKQQWPPEHTLLTSEDKGSRVLAEIHDVMPCGASAWNWHCHLHPQSMDPCMATLQVNGVGCTPTWSGGPAKSRGKVSGWYSWYREEWSTGRHLRIQHHKTSCHGHRIVTFTAPDPQGCRV